MKSLLLRSGKLCSVITALVLLGSNPALAQLDPATPDLTVSPTLEIAPSLALVTDTVFNSFNGAVPFVAFGAASGVLGVEDYIMDLSRLGLPPGATSVELTSMQFVGGVTGSSDAAGGVVSFEFTEADGSNPVAFTVNLGTEGAFIWTLTLGGIIVPTTGLLTISIDDTLPENAGRAVVGQWFIQTEANVPNPVGTSPGNPFGLPDDAGLPRVFAFELEGEDGIALPVELTSFDGEVTGQEVNLAWTTASEINNAGFTIEHRVENGPFQDAGFVAGAGTSTESMNYTFRLSDLTYGHHSFRLKQLDEDGTTHDSQTIEVVVALPVAFQAGHLYPNPMSTSGNLDFIVAADQRVNVSVFDIQGRNLGSQFNGIVEANRATTVALDLSAIAAGTYLIKVQGETFVDTRKMVVAR